MKKLLLILALTGFTFGIAQEKKDNKKTESKKENKKEKEETSRENLMKSKWLYSEESFVVTVGENENKRELYVSFGSNSYKAYDGCNDLTGKVSAGDFGQIKFYESLITQNKCGNSYAEKFLKMINIGNKYKISKGILTIYHDNDALITFKQQSEAEKKKAEKEKEKEKKKADDKKDKAKKSK